MASGLGSDFSCVSDVDESLSVVTGRLALAQAQARRLGTPKRHLFYDKEYGEDMRDLIGSARSALSIQQAAEVEMLQDERVEDTAVKVVRKEYGDPGVQADQIGDMEIVVELEDADGPFPLTLDVSKGEVTLEILEENL